MCLAHRVVSFDRFKLIRPALEIICIYYVIVLAQMDTDGRKFGSSLW